MGARIEGMGFGDLLIGRMAAEAEVGKGCPSPVRRQDVHRLHAMTGPHTVKVAAARQAC